MRRGAGLAKRRRRQHIQPLLRDAVATGDTFAVDPGLDPPKCSHDAADFVQPALAQTFQHLIAFGFDRPIIPILGVGLIQFGLDRMQAAIQFGQPGQQGSAAGFIRFHVVISLGRITLPRAEHPLFDTGQYRLGCVRLPIHPPRHKGIGVPP